MQPSSAQAQWPGNRDRPTFSLEVWRIHTAVPERGIPISPSFSLTWAVLAQGAGGGGLRTMLSAALGVGRALTQGSTVPQMTGGGASFNPLWRSKKMLFATAQGRPGV